MFEPGYLLNVSVRRLASHLVFDLVIGFYFLRELARSGIPDVFVVALPHNGAACVAVVVAKIVRAPLILDIHDTWPESLMGVTKVNPLMSVIFRLWKGLADFAILMATHVTAESISYAERANTVRRKFGKSLAIPIYLGGDQAYYKGVAKEPVLPEPIVNSSFLVAYVGTLGANYDLDNVLDSFRVFQDEFPEAALIFIGGGEREQEIQSRIEELGLRAWVSGRISHPRLVAYLKHAQIGLNCFKSGGNVAYSYKLNDYLLAGVPVVNSLLGEAVNLITSEGLGYNYSAGDKESLLRALKASRIRWQEEPAWGERVLAFSSKALNRQESYRPLLDWCLGPVDTDPNH